MNIAQEKYRPNPRSRANFLSILCFGFTFKMFKKGCKNGLDVQNLYNPLKEDRSSILGDRLQRNWQKQLSNARPSFLKAIVETFWVKLLITGLMRGFIDFGLKVYNIFMLEGLLNYFRPNTDSTWNEAMYHVGVLTLMNFMILIVDSHYNLEVLQIGMQGRVSTCALIYHKALKLSHGSMGFITPGKLVNLLSNDVRRFENVPIFINQMYSAAVSGVVLTILLYREAGLAGVIGVMAVLLFIPIQRFLIHLTGKYRKETSLKTDERVRLMDELISGIRVIKMYTWEKPLGKIINFARNTEMKFIRRASYLRATFTVLNIAMIHVGQYVTFIAMAISGTPITTVKVYVIINYYTLMLKNMGRTFETGLSELAEFRVGLKKIQDFLMTEEYQKKVKEDEETDITENLHFDSKGIVILKDLKVKWNSTTKDAALVNINVNIPEASLLGIIGPVGSGKSSLLQTILGELKIVSGSMKVGGTISYASQVPWIFCATIRQNILFGQKYDKIRYENVIQTCALDKDIKQFEDGDLMMVGDRGALLSGGQKARINLARAVYRDADIYLLDDPLSAVDGHVSNHLYHECINNFLAKKTRILVTHQVHYLRDAQQIIILKDGCIENRIENREMNSAWLAAMKTNQINNIVSRSSLKKEESSMVNKITNGLKDLPEKYYLANGRTENEEESKQASMNNVETSSKGKVKGLLVWKYLISGGSVYFIALIIFFFTAFHVIDIGRNYFLTYWLNIEESRESNDWSTATMLSIYGVFFLILVISLISRTFLFFKLAVESSNKFHSIMFTNVIRASMRFFDINPGGRILNRFTKDLGLVDEFLPKNIIEVIQNVFYLGSSAILIVIVDPYILVMMMILSLVFSALVYVYSSSSKDLRRLEGMTKSPVFTHLGNTLEGLTTIRASGAENILKNEFDVHQDLHSGAFYMFISAKAAFGFYLDIISSIFVGVLTFSVLLFERYTGVTGAEVGMLITQATSLTSLFQWTINAIAQAANELMSVERLLEYKHLPKEIQPEEPKKVPSCWPREGEIIFERMGLRYSDEGPLVLKHINLVIKPKEKVGVVGRTGAGKSSLISALFRLSPMEGIVKIDQQNTEFISSDVLRSKISIIPQNPVLFSGTLRFNLDPLEEHTDEQLYRAIEDVELKDPSNILNRLENKVMEKGLNYSVGQRQLICLARAILKNNRILLLDEATANVDPQTDAMIQETIKKKFVNCTVLTVAHRLRSIMDSDKIVVMDDGSVAEFDNPHLLLQDTGGLFYKMVEDSGISEQLRKIAADHYKENFQSQNGCI